MRYTEAQYAMMERLSCGVDRDVLSGGEIEILVFLDGEGIAESRAYIRDGFWVLSQKGTAALETYRSELRAREEQAQKEIDEAAKNEAEKKSERKFQKANTLLGAVLGFILGLIADHIGEIVPAVGAFFDWVVSLF